MVRLRLDRRLYGRIDTSDVLQDAYLDLARRFPEYAASPTVPIFIWLRSLTGKRLVDVHRRNLGAEMRDAGREVSLHRGPLPAASSASLAQHLLAGLTSPTQAAVRAEMQLRLHEVLNSMDAIDREVVVLRHFEELSNIEAAEVLPTYLARFRREAQAAGRLHHTNIVPVFGVGECEGVHYYAMQFIHGEGFDKVLADVRRLRRSLGAGVAPPTEGSVAQRLGPIGLQDHPSATVLRSITPKRATFRSFRGLTVTIEGPRKQPPNGRAFPCCDCRTGRRHRRPAGHVVDATRGDCRLRAEDDPDGIRLSGSPHCDSTGKNRVEASRSRAAIL